MQPIPIEPENDDTPAPKSSRSVHPAQELAAATAHFQGLQQRAPWAWKSYEEAEELEKRGVRQFVRN